MKFFTIEGKALTVTMHILGWVFLFIVPSYLLFIDSRDDLNIFSITSVQVILYACIFYLNYLWLIPAFFFRKNRLVYFLFATLVIVLSVFIMEFNMGRIHRKIVRNSIPRELREPAPFEQPRPEFRPRELPNPGLQFRKPIRKVGPERGWPIYNYLITSIILTGFSIGLRYSDKVAMHERQQKEVEKEKLNTELAFLKNQINPHFFFNTMNNIYSLVQINVEDGQKAILQLSKLMRYLLYETEKGNVMLSQEIEFLKNYIELMKLRLSGKVTLKVQFPDKYPDLQVPPLLFLPFIENAFKHGISYQNPSHIHIEMAVSNSSAEFRCANSIGANTENLLKTENGIGLENVRKRLALLFPARHTLQINDSNTEFEVILHIDLSKTESV